MSRRSPATADDFAPKVVIATIITDASWSPTTKCGGWAGRVTVAGARYTFSGPVRALLTSSNEVEIAAVANTLLKAVREEIMPSGCGWLLQIDNLHTVHTLNHHFQSQDNHSWPRHAPAATSIIDKAVEVIRTLREGAAKPRFILARHVKGHMRKADRDPRHHVQETMDRLAKAERLTLERQRA